MALSIKLEFGDNSSKWYNKQYKVRRFQAHYSRNYNHNHPESVPRCESITLTLPIPSKEDMMLYEWFVDQSFMSGRLVCEIIDPNNYSDSDPHIVYFDDAQAYFIGETVDFQDDKCRLLTLKIDAMRVTSNDVDFEHL